MHRPQIPRPIRRMPKVPRRTRSDQRRLTIHRQQTLRTSRTRDSPRPHHRIQLRTQPVMRSVIASLPGRLRRPTRRTPRTSTRPAAPRTRTARPTTRTATKARTEPRNVDVLRYEKAGPADRLKRQLAHIKQPTNHLRLLAEIVPTREDDVNPQSPRSTRPAETQQSHRPPHDPQPGSPAT